MQSSLWSNPSSVVTQQQQQQQQLQEQQQQQHLRHQEATSPPAMREDVCPHLKVMRLPISSDRDHRQPHAPAQVRTPPPTSQQQLSNPAARLAAFGGSRNCAEEDEAAGPAAATTATAASFPLLSVNSCLRQTPSSAAAAAVPFALVPLVTRQQGYLQQQQQSSLHLEPRQQLDHQCLLPPLASTAELALRQTLQRKRLRYRALIIVYLSCMLLFVLAVVFLAALGVFHTAGSAAGTQMSDSLTAPSEQPAAASVRQGASPRMN